MGVEAGSLDEVFSNYRAYAEEIQEQPYSGKEVVGEIINNGKIVKELGDDHREMFIILNDVEGYTVDQELPRRVSDGQVQVFAVDVWRMKQLAEKMNNTPADQQRAFLSELVYTLSVAATLTMGDLPVYSVTSSQQLQTAA